MTDSNVDLTRREFIGFTGACAAHLAFASNVMTPLTRTRWARSQYTRVVAREPFGSLERVADGVWALVSTPLAGDRTTLSNGGLIAGRNGVLAIEGFNQPAGAAWLAGKSRELTGTWPTHVLLTHYHSDHANGVAGYFDVSHKPPVHITARSRDLVLERNKPLDDARSAALKDALVISGDSISTLDLGNRVVNIAPRAGHTDSDVSVELADPGVVFCGDLFWNSMIPNFVDAVPSKLMRSVRELRRDTRPERSTTYVPGHGAVGRVAEYDRYVAMLDELDHAARAGFAAGRTTAEVAAQFRLPSTLGEWVTFSPSFYQRAFDAWYRELRQS